MENNGWGNPGPLGLGAFGLVCVSLWALVGGHIPPTNTSVVAAILIAGAVAQILTGIIDLRRGDTIGGCLMATFGCLFMISPGLTLLFTTMKLGVPAPMMGYMNIYLGLLMGVYMIPLSRASWFMFLISPLGMVLLIITGLVELGYHGLAGAASNGFLIVTLWAFYMTAASLGEAAHIHLPLGRPLVPLKIKSPPQNLST